MATQKHSTKLPQRRLTRRNVLATAAGASVLAAAYAAFGRSVLEEGAGSPGTADEAQVSGDSPALEREEVRVGHLLRRTGFGVTRDEYDRSVAMGFDATLDELLNYEAIDDSEAEGLAARVAPDGENIGSASTWWVVRMANTKRPLQEKMTLFWHGLLTSQISVVRDPVAMADQNEFLRLNALGRFPDILKGITHDRAMMVYLDIAGSRRNAPNENYARELMELFALGEGHFSEEDVREAARAFTGWTVPRQRNDANNRPTLLDPVFTPRAFDNGTKTVLGETGPFDADAIVDVVTTQPQSARYITRRLFEFFVYPNPADAVLQPFVDTYLASGMSIGATLEAMLRSEVFVSPTAYRALVKSPVEYAIGAVRALGVQANVATVLAARGRTRDGGALSQMGQVPMEPPNVAGWPGGASWLNSSTMFARLNFLNTLGTGQPRQQAPAPSMPKFATAAEAFDYYAGFLLDANLPDAARKAVLDYAGGPDAAVTAETQRDLVYLLLAMPQYHLS
jgi:uncharacterized protein (DUF1800 family)